jgi:hypothetical protein
VRLRTALLTLGLLGVPLLAEPAAASTATVATEAQYRDALDDFSGTTGPHVIRLSDDITITGAEDPLYTGSSMLTIDGQGHELNGGGTRRVLANQQLAALAVTDLTVIDGSATGDGGGIFSTGPLTITDSTFGSNEATADGGAAYVSNGGLTVTRSTFGGNDAGGDGGALTAVGATPTEVVDSTFSGNTAVGDSGGLHAPTEIVEIAGSTFSGNTAGGDGGGLVGATVAVVNSSFSGNVAVEGGGLYAFAGIDLTHTTLYGNTGGALAVEGALSTFGSVIVGDGDQCSTITPTLSGGYNWGSDESCGLTGTGDTENGAPPVEPPAANGGPTMTHLPLAAVIDAIPLVDCDADVTVDQRGRPRPQGDGCDIGAVEVGYSVDLQVRRGRQATFRDGPTLRTVKPRGYEAVFVLRLENDGEFDDSFRLRVRRGSERFTARYLSAGQDVTADVVAGTFTTPLLEPGQFRIVRARIRVNEIAPHGIERVFPARATSVGLPSRQDAISLVVAAR